MKKMVLFFIILLPSYTFSQSVMKIVYFDNYPPFSWKDANKMNGILIDVLNEAIEKRMKIPISHKGYPWARAQKLVKHGLADAFVTVPTPARKEYTLISNETVILATFNLFVKVGNPIIEELKKVKEISELKKYNVGSYIGSGWFKKNFIDKGIPGDLAPSLDMVLNKLINERIDVFIDTSQVIRFRIKKLGYKKEIVELPNVLDSATFNLCIGKKSFYTNILSEFDKTLIKMKSDGSLKKIYDKYGQ